MAGKDARWLAAWVLLLGLLAPRTARAGPYIGDWGWCWHPAPECERGEYSWLHYWAPDLYKVRAWVRPSNLDQYPPGPCPPIPPTYQFTTNRCLSTPPAPTAPYADPAAYYGQQASPE
jgi:hypothetical protein